MYNICQFSVRGLCGALVVAFSLGLARSATAWDQPQWVRQFGTPGSDGTLGLATDGAGNVYISGEKGASGGLGSRPFVAKYSAGGAPLWQRQLGTFGWAQAIATDGQRNVYIAGSDIYNALIGSYSVTGALQWVKSFAVAGEQNWANAVAADVVGDVYICGSSFQPCYGGSEGGCDTFQSNYGWIVKYSARGDLLWQQTFGFEAPGVTTDRNGNVYVVWSANGAFVSKMSPLGRVIWQRPLGSRYLGWSAATDGDGNVYVSGGSGYSISGEAFVAKLSRSGTLQWTRKLGTPRRDWASATATDSDGNVYISGYTEGSLGGAAKGDVDAGSRAIRLPVRSAGSANSEQHNMIRQRV